MLKYGTNNIGKVYLGSNLIGKAYLGNNLVYQSGGAPTPTGPVFYDNLIFDGTAYIDTDIVPSASASFKVVLGEETSHRAQRVFRCQAANSTTTGLILSDSTGDTNRWLDVFYGTSSRAGNRSLTWDEPIYTFFLTPNRYGFGNISSTITNGGNDATGGIILGSNVSHNGNPYTGIMRTFYIYGSDAQNCTKASDFSNYTPVATLRPCIYGGRAGMWHVEGERFYGNTAGSGTLTVSNNT